MLAIELTNVSKRFSGRIALDQVNLTAATNELLVLMGPSGAGKTTLLRTIAGLEQPDVGQVKLASDGPGSSLSMVTQDFALYPQLSIQRNLTTALSRLRLSREEQQRRISETLTWFEIQDLGDSLPAELSGGQCQRAAFAKALVTRPRILLLDEPLSQIDTRLKESLLELIPRVTREFQVTTLIVTHAPLDALRIADRIAVLDQGKVIEIGPAMQIYQHPKSRISGSLLSPIGMNWLSVPKFPERPSFRLHGDEANVQGNWVGFRPENVRFTEIPLNSRGVGLEFSCSTASVQNVGVGRLLLTAVDGVTLRALAPAADAVPDQNSTAWVAVDDLIWVQE